MNPIFKAVGILHGQYDIPTEMELVFKDKPHEFKLMNSSAVVA